LWVRAGAAVMNCGNKASMKAAATNKGTVQILRISGVRGEPEHT
jgi:hypothetical protein